MSLTLLGLLALFFSLILISLSKIIKLHNKKLKIKYKIQDGKITYSDLNKPSKPFFSKRYRLTGKPDYIVKNNKGYIPVEIKTGMHNKPQNNHMFQLAGYCHLIEENYTGLVPYGILVYSDGGSFKIPFDPKMRFEFESTLNNMRKMMKAGNITRNHNDYHRCKSCSMRSYCDRKLI